MTDLIGIFNADSRKSVSKFSGLRWFLVFEGLYNGEESLQANKTSKKTLEFKLKTVSNFKVTANFFNFLSFKKKKSCNKSVKLYLYYYSTQKYDNLIRTFAFRKCSAPSPRKNPPLKIQKVQLPPFCQDWKFFSPPNRKWREDTITKIVDFEQVNIGLERVCFVISARVLDQSGMIHYLQPEI